MGLTIKSAEDLQAEAKAEQLAHVREEARRYLAETDWMVVRATETGKPALRANKRETSAWLKFTLEGAGARTHGYAFAYSDLSGYRT